MADVLAHNDDFDGRLPLKSRSWWFRGRSGRPRPAVDRAVDCRVRRARVARRPAAERLWRRGTGRRDGRRAHVLVEPCPSDGTALSVNADGTSVCAPTACDADGPGATEVPSAMHALLAATRGSRSGHNIEKSGLLPLDSAAKTSLGGDSVAWARPASDTDDADADDAPSPPPAPPTTAVLQAPITVVPGAGAGATTGVKYTFTAERTPPANTAAVMATAAGNAQDAKPRRGNAVGGDIPAGLCVPAVPRRAVPGQDQFTGNYDTTNNPACSPCTQPVIP